ncbi:MAG: aldo/keto reductase [Eubacteriales bacterium]|jgi:methylglyoxal reductase
MKYREIGHSGIKTTVVGLGTWAAGGDACWGSQDDAITIRAIQEAIDRGINLIDTAPAYGFGHSERLVGKAIQGHARDQLVISTKCGLWWDDDEGAPFLFRDGKQIYRNLSKRTIKKECETSLKNLGTDYIDIYITHWQSMEPFKTPISETMEALLELKQEGKIRAIGISNVEPQHVEEYTACGQIDLIQEKYSMLDRGIEKQLLPMAKEKGITMQAYSPLEKGLLTGRFKMDTPLSPEDVRNKTSWYQPEKRAKVLAMLDSWKDLCEAHDCTLSNLVVAWTIEQYDKMSVLCGGRKSSHIIENVKGGEVSLSADELARMRRDVEALGE